MNKPRINSRHEEAAEALDSSYVELQERDLLASLTPELSEDIRVEE